MNQHYCIWLLSDLRGSIARKEYVCFLGILVLLHISNKSFDYPNTKNVNPLSRPALVSLLISCVIHKYASFNI